jgi:hypothetical protein
VVPDRAQILRALRLLARPGQVVELRALEVSTPDYRRPHTVSGYYDDPEALRRAAARAAWERYWVALRALRRDFRVRRALARRVAELLPESETPTP